MEKKVRFRARELRLGGVALRRRVCVIRRGMKLSERLSSEGIAIRSACKIRSALGSRAFNKYEAIGIRRRRYPRDARRAPCYPARGDWNCSNIWRVEGFELDFITPQGSVITPQGSET